MAIEKPEGDEPKSERFNMFISKSEMEAIEEWAWKNRIRSKSEAVRRLCRIALALADLPDNYGARSNELLGRLRGAAKSERHLTKKDMREIALLLWSFFLYAQKAKNYSSNDDITSLIEDDEFLRSAFDFGHPEDER